MNVLLFPGQGSQVPGMLLPWLDRPAARDELASWSQASGLDLLRLGTEAGAEEIRDTAVAQPLLTATALLSWRCSGVVPGAVCGHSIGELPALAVAGVLEPLAAVRLAAQRGKAMAAAAALNPTGMVAVLGGVAIDVVARAHAHGLEVATVNVAGQVVLGGPLAALEAFTADPPPGGRVRRLETAGAFHTAAMAPAVPDFAAAVEGLTPSEPRCLVVANADGAVVTSGRELVSRLVTQLTGPVRFDRCLDALAALDPTSVLELAPGGTLAALAKRALPGTAVTALRSAADLAVSA